MLVEVLRARLIESLYHLVSWMLPPKDLLLFFSPSPFALGHRRSGGEKKAEDKGGKGECEWGAERGTNLLALGHRRRKQSRIREGRVSANGGENGEPLCLLWAITGGES